MLEVVSLVSQYTAWEEDGIHFRILQNELEDLSHILQDNSVKCNALFVPVDTRNEPICEVSVLNWPEVEIPYHMQEEECFPTHS